MEETFKRYIIMAWIIPTRVMYGLVKKHKYKMLSEVFYENKSLLSIYQKSQDEMINEAVSHAVSIGQHSINLHKIERKKDDDSSYRLTIHTCVNSNEKGYFVAKLAGGSRFNNIKDFFEHFKFEIDLLDKMYIYDDYRYIVKFRENEIVVNKDNKIV